MVTKQHLEIWLKDPVTLEFMQSLNNQIKFKMAEWLFDGHETEKDANIARGMAQGFEMIVSNPGDNEIYSFAKSEEEEDANTNGV